jgi:hypothetical protein
MIEKGQKVKGFRFDELNSAHLSWNESMSQYIGVEGTVIKRVEGPHGVGSRIEIRFPRHWSGDYSNESWSNNVTAMYPLAECLQLIREEKLKEIGI